MRAVEPGAWSFDSGAVEVCLASKHPRTSVQVEAAIFLEEEQAREEFESVPQADCRISRPV